MATLEGFRVRNFRVLKDVTLGRLWAREKKEALTPMTAAIGKSGVGKSALFDAFEFLADALKSNVEEARGARGRGGFEKIRSQGTTGPIELDVLYRGIRCALQRTRKCQAHYISNCHSGKVLDHKLLETLPGEFREHADRCKGSTQVFITTHQPYFVNALDPKEVWIL